MKAISELVKELVKDDRIHIRMPQPMSWGNQEQCRSIFIEIFCQIDNTIIVYEHLPEYDQLVDWMTDSKDKGLLLMGDVGRGKSIIISGIIPVLLRIKNKFTRVIHAQELTKPAKNSASSYGHHPESNLDYLLKCAYPIIDELGVESRVNEYGEKSEGFNLILNNAERFHRPLFITTNLNSQQLLERYGERSLDRLNHLCRVIHFKGRSLRK